MKIMNPTIIEAINIAMTPVELHANTGTIHRHSAGPIIAIDWNIFRTIIERILNLLMIQLETGAAIRPNTPCPKVAAPLTAPFLNVSIPNTVNK